MLLLRWLEQLLWLTCLLREHLRLLLLLLLSVRHLRECAHGERR